MSHSMLVVMKATEQRLGAAISASKSGPQSLYQQMQGDEKPMPYIRSEVIEEIRADLYLAILELKELAK